jgi:hypothetical protein
MNHYAGIGSRETPDNILRQMEDIALYLSERGWCLRSGGAPGADSAFESRAEQKQIFVPWKNFNNKAKAIVAPELPRWPTAVEVASRIHPAWDRCSPAAQKLHARNVFQIFGPELRRTDAVEFVVCWTKGGKTVGGTATAITLARNNDIEVFNLATVTPDEVYAFVG